MMPCTAECKTQSPIAIASVSQKSNEHVLLLKRTEVMPTKLCTTKFSTRLLRKRRKKVSIRQKLRYSIKPPESSICRTRSKLWPKLARKSKKRTIRNWMITSVNNYFRAKLIRNSVRQSYLPWCLGIRSGRKSLKKNHGAMQQCNIHNHFQSI